MRPTSPKFWLIVILLFAFVSRIYRLEYPPKYVFDEVYHAVTAKLIARNDPRAYEWWNKPIEPNTAVDWLHPPYAKYTQALSMLVFGENSFGWRFSSAVFGVGVIALVYILSQLAFKNPKLSLLATFLASLDGLLLVQSRVAMNDIHVTFFILPTVIFYLIYREKKRLWYLLLTGVAGGLAIGTKWSGVFVVGWVGLLEGIKLLQLIFDQRAFSKVLHQFGLMIGSLILLPATIYLLSYSHMFLQGKDFDHLYKLHQQIWWYQTNLDATHGYQSRPWEWFWDLRPVWYHVDYIDGDTIGNIYAFGNPILFWAGAVAAIGTMVWIIRHQTLKSFKKADINMVMLLIAYLIVWLPWQLSPRVMFFYHYTPAVPLMSIILAFWLIKLWGLKIKRALQWNKLLVGAVVILTATTFLVWYPNWTALPVSKDFADNVYFITKKWK